MALMLVTVKVPVLKQMALLLRPCWRQTMLAAAAATRATLPSSQHQSLMGTLSRPLAASLRTDWPQQQPQQGLTGTARALPPTQRGLPREMSRMRVHPQPTLLAPRLTAPLVLVDVRSRRLLKSGRPCLHRQFPAAGRRQLLPQGRQMAATCPSRCRRQRHMRRSGCWWRAGLPSTWPWWCSASAPSMRRRWQRRTGARCRSVRHASGQ